MITASLALLFALSAHAQAPGGAAPASGPAPTTFVVKFRAKPGKNEALEQAFIEMQKSVKAHEPGNIDYDFYRDSTDPQVYVIVERYRNAAAIAAHGQSEHAKKLIAALGDLMDGKPEAMRLVLIRAKE